MVEDKYKVIMADPPWHYNNRANHKTRFRGGVHGHYKTMQIEEIKAMPIQDLATESAVLFLWVTFPNLIEQLEVFKAWGFEYKTVAFTWIKLNPRNYWPFFGVGHYTKSNAELCLFGTRGDVMKPAINDVSSVILAPRREHSRKPDEARLAIESLYPDASRVELFAREKATGWSAWGNEVECDLEFTP